MKFFPLLLSCFLCLPLLQNASAQEVIAPSVAIKEGSIDIKLDNGITVITIPLANTNGEDLKCVVYEAFGSDGAAGGIDCNWTPAHLSKRPNTNR